MAQMHLWQQEGKNSLMLRMSTEELVMVTE